MMCSSEPVWLLSCGHPADYVSTRSVASKQLNVVFKDMMNDDLA